METKTEAILAELPKSGRRAHTVSTAARVVRILNGADLVLGGTGVVPPGSIPLIANIGVAILAEVVSWFAEKKSFESAASIVPSQQLRSHFARGAHWPS